ncbi:paralemmin-2-like [Centropristis striata]|uniref:paralemmin-2-like n=1 Tax=Centropristis striata TaxID=184440 RepID=UPI0027E1648C|nr:paralemmin-2-like [Centropristis striata]
MDEAEKYQQRLQAIAERRQQQEEEQRLTRETEEEWLKTAQEKRKCLREQWLSESAPAPDSFRLGPRPDDQATTEQTKSQKRPEDKDEEAADARKQEQASRKQNKESVNCTAAARTNSHYQAATDQDVQVNKEAEDHFSIEMAQRMFHESGQEGRSVLGMLAVQVERDPQTGTTVVRSVAPMSAPPAAPTATTIFDDGRKSIHAIGGSGSEPSTEELGQILSIVDGVGMRVLLEEVTVTPTRAETKIEDAIRAPEGKTLSLSTHQETPEEDHRQLDSRGLDSGVQLDSGAQLEIEDCAAVKDEHRSMVAAGDVAGEVGNVEDLSLEEGPVTLVFLGYTDGEQAQSQEGPEGITVERVMISEDGEELVLGPQTAAPPQAGSEPQTFQDVPLDGNGAGVKVQEEEREKEHHSSAPTNAEAGGTKRKTCQCCSVM